MNLHIKTFKEINQLNSNEKMIYYSEVYKLCAHKASHIHKCFPKMIAKLAPSLRHYEMEIRGLENLPDEAAVFMCNHSNSHDFFTIMEVEKKLNRVASPLGAWDGLNFVTRAIFRLSNVVLIKRDNRKSKDSGIEKLCSNIISGCDGYVFGEATWNLHPYLPMMPVKAGGTYVALVTNKLLVPTVFEYVENSEICKREKDLYKKVIVCFGKPCKADINNNIFDETLKIQNILEGMREELWTEFGVKKDSIDHDVYVNHTYLKKYKGLGFKYNSDAEYRFLLKQQSGFENEYCINYSGEFVSGIITKNNHNKKI